MNNINTTVHAIHFLDRLSKGNSFVHKVHPLMKVLITFIYIAIVMSFNKYEIISLFSFILYPVVIFILGDIPVIKILKRVVFVLPILLGVGIFNPLFDHYFYIYIGDIPISSGTLSLVSLLIRGILTLLASFLLIATASIEEITYSLRRLGLPKLFVLQILLTYRYIYLLLDEIVIMYTAYSLRAPHAKGLTRNTWAAFLGQLILKTYKKAHLLYHSMSLRGFNGEYIPSGELKIKKSDVCYLGFWVIFCTYARCYSLPVLLESLLLNF